MTTFNWLHFSITFRSSERLLFLLNKTQFPLLTKIIFGDASVLTLYRSCLLPCSSSVKIAVSERSVRRNSLEKGVSLLSVQLNTFPRLLSRIQYTLVQTIIDSIRTNVKEFISASTKSGRPRLIAHLLLDVTERTDQQGNRSCDNYVHFPIIMRLNKSGYFPTN